MNFKVNPLIPKIGWLMYLECFAEGQKQNISTRLMSGDSHRSSSLCMALDEVLTHQEGPQ